MARNARTWKTASFVYDFDVDGGQAGYIMMGAYLPAGSVVAYGVANVITELTTGAAPCNVGVGYSGGWDGLINKTGVASWGDNAILEGVDMTVTMVLIGGTAVSELDVEVEFNWVTAGRFIYACQYYER